MTDFAALLNFIYSYRLIPTEIRRIEIQMISYNDRIKYNEQTSSTQ